MVYVPLSPRRREAFLRLRSDPLPASAQASTMLRPITFDELAPAEELRDCVRTYPVSGDDNIMLVVYDGEGDLKLEMRLPKAWVTEGLEKFLLRMVRYYSRFRLRRLK